MIYLFSLIRAIFYLPFVIIWTGISSILIVLCQLLRLPKPYFATPVSHVWAWGLLKFPGVRLDIRHHGELPETGYLYVLNHTSHMDILAVFVSCKKFVHFGAKIELFKIPIFGTALRLVGKLPIERKNRAKVFEIYKQAEARVKAGDVFALAPEGTRTNLDGELGRFKKGPFLFAIHSQMPIVPAVVTGCREVLPKGKLLANLGAWSRTIQVDVLPPIYPEGRSEDQLLELMEKVRFAMDEKLKEVTQ